MFARRQAGCCLCLRRARPASRAFSASSIATSSASTPTPSSTLSAAPLSNRSLIEISGRDTLKLLQGLITNDVNRLAKPPSTEQPVQDALYAGFLHPNGRLLADTLLYSVPSEVAAADASPSDRVLIEVDTRAASTLLAFLKKFKLRSKVALRLTEPGEWNVWHLWTPGSNALTPANITSSDASDRKEQLASLMGGPFDVRRDPRSTYMGYRILAPAASSVEGRLGAMQQEASYLAHRILQGIPEGVDDIVDTSSLPLEVNLDLNDGVDFKKGCYVGQELTARTHHTGVVRKRVVPVTFYAPEQLPPAELALQESFETIEKTSGLDVRSTSSASAESGPRRPRSAGKLLGSTVHNLGLALLRLDQVERADKEAGIDGGARMRTAATGRDGQQLELGVRPFIPAWWDPQVIESVRLATA